MFEGSRRKHKDRTSALVIIWTWMQVVDSDSKSRLSQSISRWLKRNPTQHAADLYDDCLKFKRELGTMSRLGMGAANDPVFSKLIEQAMDRMTSELTRDPQLLKLLTVPMANVAATTTDVTVMLETLEACARELMHVPRKENNRFRPWHPRGREANGSQAAAAATGQTTSEIICFLYREMGKCPRKDLGKCKFNHTGRSGQLCKDKGYTETGVCSKYKECVDCHKWDQIKHGSLEERIAKAKASANGSAEAEKRFLKASAGVAFAATTETGNPMCCAALPGRERFGP